MPISQSRYVNINSTVEGNGGVSQRSLNMRMITTNSLVPSGTVLTFNGGPQAALADIAEYFGDTSAEYLRAVPYFGFVSKQGITPQSLDYYFWNNDSATASLIFGVQAAYALSSFTSVSSGSLNLTLGGFTHTLTGINLSAAGSLAAVATDIQTAINAYSAGGAAWTGATVAYVASPTQGGLPQFTLTSGATGTDTVSVQAPVSGTDVGALLGWETGAIYSNGTAAQTPVQMLSQMVQNNNNFGTFIFVLGSSMTNTNIEAIAAWNAAENNLYRYSIATLAGNAATICPAVATFAGCDVTLVASTTDYAEQIPGTVEAATDYTQRGASQNFMYQSNFVGLTPTVTTDTNANTYDAFLCNYYGQTQNAGQLINFYQRGVMMGGTNAPQFQGIYANEQWLKSAIFTALMNLLLAFTEVSADAAGQALVLAQVQSVINQALFNGVISVGKTLTALQQAAITQITGDPTAWKQVQNQGYWINCVIQQYVNSMNNLTEFKAVYTLVYSKNDAINFIQGNDDLI